MSEPETVGSRESGLVADGVVKRYQGTIALAGARLDVARGEIHALAGGNGSGKSTLIKILAGIESADQGTLSIDGRTLELSEITPQLALAHRMYFVHQERSVFPDLTIAENLALGASAGSSGLSVFSGRRAKAAATRTLELFKINAKPETLVRDLSPALQTLVAIARALQHQDEFGDGVLVLDEPTSMLQDKEARILLTAVSDYAARGQSVILVTHRLDEVLQTADRITVLRDGRNVATGIPNNLSRDQLAELITGKERARTTRRSVGPTSDEILLSLVDVVAGPLQGVSLKVRAGEIVGIAGSMDSGASELVSVAAGISAPSAGEVSYEFSSGTVGHAYVPPDRLEQAIFPDESVGDNLLIASLRDVAVAGWLVKARENTATALGMERFDIKASSPKLPISKLSGGNQQKTVLARWMRMNPLLYLLDEPTQGVDIGSRDEIWQFVTAAVADGAGVLVTAADVEELAAVCDRVLVLSDGRIVAELISDQVTVESIVAAAHREAP